MPTLWYLGRGAGKERQGRSLGGAPHPARRPPRKVPGPRLPKDPSEPSSLANLPCPSRRQARSGAAPRLYCTHPMAAPPGPSPSLSSGGPGASLKAPSLVLPHFHALWPSQAWVILYPDCPQAHQHPQVCMINLKFTVSCRCLGKAASPRESKEDGKLFPHPSAAFPLRLLGPRSLNSV